MSDQITSEQVRNEEPESSCGQPCDSNNACPECEEYWNRMVDEGYWNVERHQWTKKGWKEITKWP
jgi:hypothetical protein